MTSMLTTELYVTGNDTDGGRSGMVHDGDGDGVIEDGGRFSIAAIICLPILIIIGVVGNTLVCVAVIKIYKLRTVANSFVVSLAISDLAVCLIVLPLGLYEAWNFGVWHLGEVVCNSWLVLDLILSTASVWNLCAIAGDRWLAITKPIWYANRRSAKLAGIAMAVAWGIPVLLTIPYIALMQAYKRERPDVCYPHADPRYAIFVCIVAFYVPCIIVLAVYIRIFMAARDHFLRKPGTVRNRKQSSADNPVDTRAPDSMAESSQGNNAHSIVNGKTEHSVAAGSMGDINRVGYGGPPRKISTSASEVNSVELTENRQLKRRTSRIPRIHVNREKKAAIVLSIVVGAFIVCWLPYFTAVFLVLTGVEFVNDHLFVAFAWLGWLNSIINPIIYTIFNRDFRKAFKHILQCECNNWIGSRWSSTSK